MNNLADDGNTRMLRAGSLNPMVLGVPGLSSGAQRAAAPSARPE